MSSVIYCIFCPQAGLLRTAQGEYWIEPSTQKPDNSSDPRPHVIFRRSAVDKVEAYHRAKRDLNNRRNSEAHLNRNNQRKDNKRQRVNSKRNRELKEARDKRRREYLEQRRRKMLLLRQNPTEYRRHQARLRLEARRLQSNSRSNSVENSRSVDQSSSLENKYKKRVRLTASDSEKLRRVKNRRRRKKRSKNCATKEPRNYIWRQQNLERQELQRQNRENRVSSKVYKMYLNF